MGERFLTKAKGISLKATTNKFKIVEYSSKISAKINDKWHRHNFYLIDEEPSFKYKTNHFRLPFIHSTEFLYNLFDRIPLIAVGKQLY